MVVSPLQLIVGEGDRVSFDCLVIGTIVESINWTRDFEKLTPSEVSTGMKCVFFIVCIANVYMQFKVLTVHEFTVTCSI